MEPPDGLSLTADLETVYSFPPYSKVSVTCVGVVGSAYFERSMEVLRLSPLGSPNRAYVIASKIVVLPAPVSPVIRYRPFLPSLSISISTVPE